MNIAKRITLWRREGLIDEATAARLLEFERGHTGHSWVAFGVVGIGVTAVILGVVSLVASNWDAIPDAAKIAAYFALQLSVGFLFIRREQSPGLAREVSLAIFALLFWAGIGLFAQVFNLVGDGWQAMCFWAILALPAVLCSDSLMLCSLWCLDVLSAGLVWLVVAEYWPPADANGWLSPLGRVCMVVTLPLLLSGLGLAGFDAGWIRRKLRDSALFWGLGGLLLVLTPFANAAWVDGGSELLGSGQRHFLAAPWAATLVGAALALKRRAVGRELRISTSALLVACAAYATIPLLWHPAALVGRTFNEVLGALGFILVWALAATSAAHASMKIIFNIASCVIGLRLVVVYFEVFGSLAVTGIGLIISGALVIASAAGWNHLRRSTAHWFMGGSSDE